MKTNTALVLVEPNQESYHRSISRIGNAQEQNSAWLQTVHTLENEMSGESKRAYASDALVFKQWLEGQGIIDIGAITYDMAVAYCNYLKGTFSKSTAARRFTVMRRVLQVAVRRNIFPREVFETIKEFKSKIKLDESSPHTALSKREAKRLLAAVESSTPMGKRDYAILMLLIYCGIRRAECAAIKLADIVLKDMHHVLVVQHGKGNKRRDIPLRPDVFRAISVYLESVDRLNDSPESLLFTGFYKGSKPSHSSITDRQIANIVQRYAVKAQVKATPHDLRASAITFWFDTGAPIVVIQRLAGHDDPKTTERYYTRKMDIDNSPVYKVDLNS